MILSWFCNAAFFKNSLCIHKTNVLDWSVLVRACQPTFHNIHTPCINCYLPAPGAGCVCHSWARVPQTFINFPLISRSPDTMSLLSASVACVVCRCINSQISLVSFCLANVFIQNVVCCGCECRQVGR